MVSTAVERMEKGEEEKELAEEFSTVLEDSINNIYTEEENINLIFKNRDALEAGMVAGRHNMPIDKYVFDSALTNKQMSNFEWQEEVALNFLKNELGFVHDKKTDKDIPSRDLILYATGIQSVICSIFKVCTENHVNLTVMNFDPHTDKYHPQVVLSGNPVGSQLIKMFPNCNTLEAIGYDRSNIVNISDYYSIRKTEYDGKGNALGVIEIVAATTREINRKFYEMVGEAIKDRSTHVSLELSRSSMKSGTERNLERRFLFTNCGIL